ncbi:MAG: hypothetical protein GDA56_18255 [Hormoscilla sp. GM7CHS1pb]|nr:hypothetical protein [Hormoscilla sp. GM7CHS1pb]
MSNHFFALFSEPIGELMLENHRFNFTLVPPRSPSFLGSAWEGFLEAEPLVRSHHP